MGGHLVLHRAASPPPQLISVWEVSAILLDILIVQEKPENQTFSEIGLPTYWLNIVIKCIG